MKEQKCRLRKASDGDMDLLFQWANDPAVRSFSFTTDPIAYETHQAWFRKMMANADVLQYILMDGDEPVGQIRLNVEGDLAEIGYSISSDCRGRGYGCLLLNLTAQEVSRKYPQIKRLIAVVKTANAASRKILEKADYMNVRQSSSAEAELIDILGLKDIAGRESIVIYEKIIRQ